jgi:hypothetical protein
MALAASAREIEVAERTTLTEMVESRVTHFTRACETVALLLGDRAQVLRLGVARRGELAQLVLKVGAKLSRESEDEALALDRKAVRVLVQRERGLLLDLLQLGDQVLGRHRARIV